MKYFIKLLKYMYFRYVHSSLEVVVQASGAWASKAWQLVDQEQHPVNEQTEEEKHLRPLQRTGLDVSKAQSEQYMTMGTCLLVENLFS